MTLAGLNEAFRLAHTLKGSAHIVGLPTVVTLAHRLESFFAKIRDSILKLGTNEIRIVFSVLDMIEDIVTASRAGSPLPDIQNTLDKIEAVLELKPAPHLSVAQAPQTSLTQLQVTASSLKPNPSVAEHETVRLNASHLDQLLGTTGELLSIIRGTRQVDTQMVNVSARVDSITLEWELLRRMSAGTLQKMNQSPEFARICQFLDFVGTELSPLSKQIHAVRHSTHQNEWDLNHLSKQLEDDVRRARIVPAETVLGFLNKMVRDLANELGRPVDFRCVGLEVEADRLVLQSLKDPLMHMLRNSIGHGIEPHAVRQSVGKDPVGRILVRLVASGGQLKIMIEDDGQGLNEIKIRDRAVSMGLVAELESNNLTGHALSELIFQPGFSTAQEVSNLSGRGIGMSVVAEAIKRLQGHIEVESKPGKGTTFSIFVPIALTNHRVILISYSGASFAIPCRDIESLYRIQNSELKMVDGAIVSVYSECANSRREPRGRARNVKHRRHPFRRCHFLRRAQVIGSSTGGRRRLNI